MIVQGAGALCMAVGRSAGKEFRGLRKQRAGDGAWGWFQASPGSLSKVSRKARAVSLETWCITCPYQATPVTDCKFEATMRAARPTCTWAVNARGRAWDSAPLRAALPGTCGALAGRRVLEATLLG